MIDSTTITTALKSVAATTLTASDELCAADGALGDGDLGITVSKGFGEAAQAALAEDIGLALLEIAKAFQRVSSSSYGTLLATGFMAAAKLTKGTSTIEPAALPAFIVAARDAMMSRGKGQLGDKTVLDSLDAVAKAIDGASASAMVDKAIAAASDTLKTTARNPTSSVEHACSATRASDCPIRDNSPF